MNAPKLNGYQVRTERTKGELLAAAEEVFSRDGFEAAQMDSIAKAAGRSKGAIYAHYKSKDDLFLALFEDRTRLETRRVFDRVLETESREGALKALKDSLVAITKNRTWILLTVEAKLYALRHPEMRERWLAANRAFRPSSEVSGPQYEQTSQLIYGKLTPSQKAEVEARTMALGPIITGLVLEAEFEPDLLTKGRLAAILNEIVDTLLRPPEESRATTSSSRKSTTK